MRNQAIKELLMQHELGDVTIYRKGFGLKDQVSGALKKEYSSSLTKHLRENGQSLEMGDLRILLAKDFGFCYGVDRAIDYAYETREMFPGKTIYITYQIIHNPRVNNRLKEMGIRFLSGDDDGENWTHEDVTEDDVVILPAFGASMEQMQRLAKTGCTLVDTTCGSVMHVWKRVERYSKDGFTALIHGKYSHEETRATASRALKFETGHYLIVRDEAEAQYVCDYIRHGGDRQEFLEKFANAVSPGFDPDRDLQQIGVANQTTMLSSESLHIAKMVQTAMIDRFGAENIKSHFRSFDTICSATQERQDAIIELGKQNPDLILVVGGYNSSNTNHLTEIGLRYAPTFHINEVECILSRDSIRHKPFGQKEEVVRDDWLPQGPVSVGVTAGASTPDKVVEEVIYRVLECCGYTHEQVLEKAGLLEAAT